MWLFWELVGRTENPFISRFKVRTISETKSYEKSDVLEEKSVKEFSVVAKQCRQTAKRFILLSS